MNYQKEHHFNSLRLCFEVKWNPFNVHLKDPYRLRKEHRALQQWLLIQHKGNKDHTDHSQGQNDQHIQKGNKIGLEKCSEPMAFVEGT